MEDRKVKSYQDIAEYILSDLRLAQTGVLPAELGDVLSRHSVHYTVPLYPLADVASSVIVLNVVWNPSSRELCFYFDVNGNYRIQEFRYTVGKKDDD